MAFRFHILWKVSRFAAVSLGILEKWCSLKLVGPFWTVSMQHYAVCVIGDCGRFVQCAPAAALGNTWSDNEAHSSGTSAFGGQYKNF